MEPFDRRMLLGAAGLVGVAALARSARGGPLDPPAGPITSTGKTLSQVEPRTAITALPMTISQSGSYYLASSFTVSGSNAITITADNVAIDLMGFTLTQSGAGVFSGIEATGVRRGISVRNGMIKGFGRNGVALRQADASVIEDLLVESSGQSGIIVANASVSRCISRLNTESGFEVSASGSSTMKTNMFLDCRGTENTVDGFKTDPGNANNSGGYLFGRCIASQNGRYGFFAGLESTLIDCLARQNTSHGYNFEDGCNIESCAAIRNTGGGIIGGGFATIRNCTASDNTLSGIKVNSVSHVVGCRATYNGGTSTSEAGFQFGGANTIDGNFASNNSQGFFTGAAATGAVTNIITRNVAIANGATSASNYAVGSGNQLGPVYNTITGGGSVANPYANVSTHSA